MYALNICPNKCQDITNTSRAPCYNTPKAIKYKLVNAELYTQKISIEYCFH